MPAGEGPCRCWSSLAEAGCLLLLDEGPASWAQLTLPGCRSPSGQLGTLCSLAATVSADTPAPAGRQAG